MPSKCLAQPGEPQSAVPYLRNKNIELHPRARSLAQRAWSRLLRFVLARHRRALLADDPQVVISEQIIENAMVLRNIPATARTVLDFGGVESLLPMTLAALGYQVTVWDQRTYAFTHPLLSVVRRDILEPPPRDLGSYDVVVSVSTIEHLGLGSYGDVTMDDADARGVAMLWSLVAPGGRMIATVPAGRAAVHRGFRVYDRERLFRVFPQGSSVHYFHKGGRDAVWRSAPATAIDAIEYEAPDAPLPVDALAVVIADKR
jgi:2-polyprenyl-3-methyl-5-hydroxy-6-metoxy-1,4-benzoquinol methylase